jgi:hypothetical protein
VVLGSSEAGRKVGWNAVFCPAVWDAPKEAVSSQITVDFSDMNDGPDSMFAAFKAAALADEKHADLWSFGNGTGTINWRRRGPSRTTTPSFRRR